MHWSTLSTDNEYYIAISAIWIKKSIVYYICEFYAIELNNIKNIEAKYMKKEKRMAILRKSVDTDENSQFVVIPAI